MAHDRSDKLDAACAKQNEKDTPQLVTPVAPVSQDPCNPVGSPVGFSNVSWQAAPIAANGYTWSLSADGTTYTATAEEGFMLVNSDNSVSKTINYILPTDTGVMCGMGGGGDTPETPVTPVTPTNLYDWRRLRAPSMAKHTAHARPHAAYETRSSAGQWRKETRPMFYRSQ